MLEIFINHINNTIFMDEEQLLEKIIQKENGKIKVDWSFFNRANQRKFGLVGTGYGYYEKFCDEVIEKLQKLDVLTSSTKDSYVVMGNGICINPSSGMSNYYFTNFEDAKCWAENAYGNAIYPVHILKFVIAIKRKE